MLPDQRALFDIPEDVVYFNCAYLSPNLKAQREMGHWAIDRKVHPWTIEWKHFYDDVERARVLFARLINASAEDIAVVVLTNRTNKSTALIAEELLAAVLPKYDAALRAERGQPKKAPPDLHFAPVAGFAGKWSGTLKTWQEKIPLELELATDGHVYVRLGDQLNTVLSHVNVRGAHLTGRSVGMIPTPDANRHPHEIIFDLWMRGNRLGGQASAHAVTVPGDRVQTSYGHYMLTSYVDLVRQSP